MEWLRRILQSDFVKRVLKPSPLDKVILIFVIVLFTLYVCPYVKAEEVIDIRLRIHLLNDAEIAAMAPAESKYNCWKQTCDLWIPEVKEWFHYDPVNACLVYHELKHIIASKGKDTKSGAWHDNQWFSEC